MSQSAYDFTFDNLHGGPLPLQQFAGKVLLVVNTASKCGFSVQYGPLRELQTAHQLRGFSVLGVPSNDFNQEPLDATALQKACQERFLCNFPMTGKTSVRGTNAHPLYQWIRKQSGFWATPRHNFYKYLIGRNGEFLEWYSPLTSPTASSVVRAIERALKAS